MARDVDNGNADSNRLHSQQINRIQGKGYVTKEVRGLSRTLGILLLSFPYTVFLDIQWPEPEAHLFRAVFVLWDLLCSCAEEPKRTGFACMWMNHLSFFLPLYFLLLSLSPYILPSPILVKRFTRSANSLTSNGGNAEIVTHTVELPCCLGGTCLRSQPQPRLAFPTLSSPWISFS